MATGRGTYPCGIPPLLYSLAVSRAPARVLGAGGGCKGHSQSSGDREGVTDRTQWSARGHTGQRVAAGERGPRRGLGDRGGAVGQRPQGRATRRRGVWGTPCGLRELHRSRDRAGPGRGPRGQRLRLCCWRGQMMCTGGGPRGLLEPDVSGEAGRTTLLRLRGHLLPLSGADLHQVRKDGGAWPRGISEKGVPFLRAELKARRRT